MLLQSNAKINLGLSIINRRIDGFHNIESLFIPIPWCDKINIEKAEQSSFSSAGIAIDGNADDNLCMKAFRLLQRDFKLSNVSIQLQKNIPIGAGLGGGSADAAFVLKGLNQLFELNLGEDSLNSYADQLGSDCSFFIKNKAAFVSGKGELLNYDIPLRLNTHCIVVNPNIHISTKEAYSNVKPRFPEVRILDALKKPKSEWQNCIQNDFEEGLLLLHPALKQLKRDLLEMGAYYVSMTGSGSSYFAFFDEEIDNMLFNPNYAFRKFQLNV